MHIFWIFGHTCWLLYKRIPFVQTRSTNFFVLLEKFQCFFLLVRIHFVLFFTCSRPPCFCIFFFTCFSSVLFLNIYLLHIHFACCISLNKIETYYFISSTVLISNFLGPNNGQTIVWAHFHYYQQYCRFLFPSPSLPLLSQCQIIILSYI